MKRPTTGDRAWDALDQLRPIVREAHELLKDIRTERKALEAVRDEARDMLPRLVTMHVSELIDREVGRQLEQMGPKIQRVVDKVGQIIQAKLDRHVRIMVGEDEESVKEGRPSLMDLLDRVAEIRRDELRDADAAP